MEKPESIKVTAGDTCTLECTVSGTPELSTKWIKDGKELTSDSKYKISFFNKVSGLKIINVAPGDSGVYSFEVQNPVGKDSCKVSIQVSGWLACSFVFVIVGTPVVLSRREAPSFTV